MNRLLWLEGVLLVAGAFAVFALPAGLASRPAPPPPDDMVEIAAGPAWIGCVGEKDVHCKEGERPGHRVEVPAFAIDRTEVTVAAYRGCVRAGACTSTSLRMPVWFRGNKHPEFGWSCNWGRLERDDHPINCVSWDQAVAYCAWLGKRLPTDAEWEKAARGGDRRTVYPWGDDPPTRGSPLFANVADYRVGLVRPDWDIPRDYDDGYAGTAPVGSFPDGDSPDGLKDMAGNVEEWTSDWYDASLEQRSIRGGSWHRGPERVRISRMYPSDLRAQPEYGGFRCARSAPPGP